MTKRASAAFPNAYIDTNELPRRSWTRTLSLVGAVGVSYFGLTVFILSLFSTEYSPITQFASDYGVGTFALEMNVGFVMGGLGMVSFALASAVRMPWRASRAGSVMLFIAGLGMTMSSYFTTDIEGMAGTLHGAIHNVGGVLVFVLAPFGILGVYSHLGRGRFLLVLVGLITGTLFEVANSALGLNAAGLAERVLILVIFSSVIWASLSLYRAPDA